MKINGITISGGTSGTSGTSGSSGTSGTSGSNGSSGTSGISAISFSKLGSNPTFITGVNSEQKSLSVLIPANTINNNNALIHIFVRSRKVGANSGTITLRINNNIIDSTVGQTFLTIFTMSAGTNRMVNLESRLFYKFSTGQVERVSPGTFASEYGVNNTYTAANFNKAVDNYIIFTNTNQMIADTSVVDFALITIYQ